MTRQFLKHIIDKLRAAGFDNKLSPFVGCTNSEIESLERELQINLPGAYKEFLSVMGKSCGDFLLGYDYTYQTVFGLTRESQSLIAEDSSCDFRLAATDFVFISSQGSQFLFFDTGSGDDPPVQIFMEGLEKPKQKYDSFSHCLEQLADSQIQSAKERERV